MPRPTGKVSETRRHCDAVVVVGSAILVPRTEDRRVALVKLVALHHGEGLAARKLRQRLGQVLLPAGNMHQQLLGRPALKRSWLRALLLRQGGNKGVLNHMGAL